MIILSNKFVNLKKLDYKIRKNKADLELLTSCQHNQLTPKFLNFKGSK